MKTKLLCFLGLALYSGLSVLDFVLTFALMQINGSAYESNPFAAACLEQHGWRGLAAFKAGGVLVFVASVALVSTRRPQVGAGIAALGCAVLLVVTGYSRHLISQARLEIAGRDAGWGPPPRDTLREPYLGLFAAR
ncbi:MAG: hypothetical protein JWO38_7793 [Gemmataceae bacterium]|nr:hypothetical protein [Gemmataceae bacterium]